MLAFVLACSLLFGLLHNLGVAATFLIVAFLLAIASGRPPSRRRPKPE